MGDRGWESTEMKQGVVRGGEAMKSCQPQRGDHTEEVHEESLKA